MPNVPPCVGSFELDDLTCNGDPNGETREEQAPCAWRNRCAGLQQYCAEGGHSPDIIVATLSHGALVQLCETQIEKHKIVGGILEKQRQEAPEKIKAVEKQRSRRKKIIRKHKLRKRMVAPQKRYQQNKVDLEPNEPPPRVLTEAAEHLNQLMHDMFPDRRFGSGRRVLVRPGTFYSVDRLKSCQYVSWYCVSPKGRDYALLSLFVKPRTGLCDMQMGIKAEELITFAGEKLARRLNIEDFPDGQFKSICMNLDREGIGLCVDLLRRLIYADIILLPGSRPLTRRRARAES